jgi:serine/threonine protein phosphatase 1
MYNVIGDVAGQLDTLNALLTKMPQAKTLCLGDPNDRGPDSKGVIDFLIQTGSDHVMSNHSHFMTEAWKQSSMPGAHPRYYEKDIWFYNGAIQTLTSYNPDWPNILQFSQEGQYFHFREDKLWTLIPKDHYQYLMELPKYIETHKFIYTHAPIHQNLTIELACDIGNGFSTFNYDYQSNSSILWNRNVPDKPNNHLNGKINIFGHNASDAVKVYCKKYPNGIKCYNNEDFKREIANIYDVWAICLDTSGAKKLTGLNIETMELYEQEYI